MNTSITRLWDDILNRFVADEVLTSVQASSLSKPSHMQDIIPIIRNSSVDENTIVNVISSILDIEDIFSDATILSDSAFKGTLNDCTWLINDNVAYLSDPLNDILLKYLHKKYNKSFIRIGFLPRTDSCKGTWLTVNNGEQAVDTSDTSTAEARTLFEQILAKAVAANASDIHIYPGIKNKIEVRIRVDGSLIPCMTYAESLHDSLERVLIDGPSFCNTILTKLTPQPGAFEYKGLSYRVERIPVGRSPKAKIVLRQFQPQNTQATLEDFSLTSDNIKLISDAVSRLSGIILSTGPTGSGKSSMLIAAVSKAMSKYPDRSYSSLEDPIEQVVEGVTQIQVNKNISFAEGLRSLKRQDPDVILVGEIRDEETARLAVDASITGHLVLSTQHTINSHKVFDGFREMGIFPSVIAQAVSLIISQRLVKLLCPKCKVDYFLSEDRPQAALYSEILDPEAKGGVRLFKAGKGCSECSGTSYKGRIAIVEVLSVTPDIEDAIIENVPMNQIRRRTIQDGSFTDIWIDGLSKVKDGITSIDSIERMLPPIELDRPYLAANLTKKLVN
jgi:type II secretory ATPase GspE/PulE/Tfp pilus assembly ATPase PilB-like protein